MYIKNKIKNIYFILHKYTKCLYRFNYKNYPKIHFLKTKNKDLIFKSVDEIIYCFWTGHNEMSEQRNKAFQSILDNAKVKVCLITPENLDQYILKDYPLHEAYQYLSNVHKSDYLRCYFMYHYGGGYTDIKFHNKSWKKAFKKLNSSKNSFALGVYEESNSSENICYVDSFFDRKDANDLNYNMKIHYLYLIGSCSYIFKANSSFAKDWINELNRRLDLLLNELKINPGNIMGDNEGYPIKWNSILGQIFHPLCLKYHKGLLHDDSIKPSYENYR